jgi:hypothetical protein
MNDSRRIDNEKGPFADTIPIAVHSIFAGNCSFGLEISKQREMQLAISGKSRVAPRSINRYADEFGA